MLGQSELWCNEAQHNATKPGLCVKFETFYELMLSALVHATVSISGEYSQSSKHFGPLSGHKSCESVVSSERYVDI